MSFVISSSVYPTARRAAIFAIGNPVALEARALERETRGFISITRRVPSSRVDRELDVGTARLDPDPTDARERVVAHLLVLDVRQGLRGGDRYGVPRVHAHRVEVLDGADDDAVVRCDRA